MALANDYWIIDVQPVNPTLGAEVRGVNLAEGVSDDAFSEIHRAFLEHQVLFFKDQPEQMPVQVHKDFGRRFGTLHLHPAAPHLEGHPEIFVIHGHKDTKIPAGRDWHTDVSCDAEPPMGTMLQNFILPDCGGDTLFASMYAAYEGLSPAMKEFLDGKTAEHGSEHVYRARYAEHGIDDMGREYAASIHPVIRTHPETGKRGIYVNETFTTRIQELEKEESDALLAFLYAHIAKPRFQVRFPWEQNDTAMWDNRCVQHIAMFDYWPQERKGHRVTIKGDAPFYQAAGTGGG